MSRSISNFDLDENQGISLMHSYYFDSLNYSQFEGQNSFIEEEISKIKISKNSRDNYELSDYDDEDTDPIFLIINTKRDKQIHICPKDPEKRCHTFKSTDNMIKTLKIKFFKFLFNLCNDYIYSLTENPEKKLLNILHAVKTDVTIKVNLIIKDFTIKEIYSLPIGKKYRKYKYVQNHNAILMKELSEDKTEFKKFFNTKLYEMLPYFVDINKKHILENKYKIKKAVPLYELVKTCKQFKGRQPKYIQELFKLGNNFFDYFISRKERTSQSQKKILCYLQRIINQRNKW